MPNDLLLALRRSHKTIKPSTHLQESIKYLNRPIANNIKSENWIPRTFKEAMRQPDLWWEPMAAEIAMLKAREVYEIVPRPVGRNIVRFK